MGGIKKKYLDMKKNIKFETFVKKNSRIQATPYKKGMEDGFVIRYGVTNGGGFYHTYTFPYGIAGEKKIKVPYVINGDDKILLGEHYHLILYPDGTTSNINSEEFEEQYVNIKDQNSFTIQQVLDFARTFSDRTFDETDVKRILKHK